MGPGVFVLIGAVAIGFGAGAKWGWSGFKSAAAAAMIVGIAVSGIALHDWWRDQSATIDRNLACLEYRKQHPVAEDGPCSPW